MSNDASPPSPSPSHNPPSHPTLSQQKPHLQRSRRLTLLDDLIRNIDILIYCELSILYYLDCSLLHLLLRALPQWFYFTPKPAQLPLPPPSRRPYVSAICGSNALVLLVHAFAATPAAGEAVRGYLHGGLLIDFVGEAGPVARWRLVGLDVLVWALQCCLLALFLERAAVRGEVGAGEGEGAGQDHDAEERGLLRAEAGGEVLDRGAGEEGLGGGDDLLDWPSASMEHPLDTYHTGEHVIANLHILDALRRQWAQYGSGAADASTSSTTGSQTAMAAAVAGRRFGFRLRLGDRVAGGAPS